MDQRRRRAPGRDGRAAPGGRTPWAAGGLVIAALAVWLLLPVGPALLSLAALASAAVLVIGPAGGRMQRGERVTSAAASSFPKEVARELDRARRYGRPFALVRISSPLHLAADGSTPDTDLGALLSAEVRRTDSFLVDGPVAYVLMPEAEHAECLSFGQRLARKHPEIDVAAHLRVAVFPADGLTRDALLDRLAQPGASAQEDTA
jgi:hypothetical protein